MAISLQHAGEFTVALANELFGPKAGRGHHRCASDATGRGRWSDVLDWTCRHNLGLGQRNVGCV